MQMKTLREDVFDQMDLAIMMCFYTLKADAWTNKTARNVNAEWCEPDNKK